MPHISVDYLSEAISKYGNDDDDDDDEARQTNNLKCQLNISCVWKKYKKTQKIY